MRQSPDVIGEGLTKEKDCQGCKIKSISAYTLQQYVDKLIEWVSPEKSLLHSILALSVFTF